MHEHEVCEQLMAAARRSGHMGRLEYLATRCDIQHGDQTAARTTQTTTSETDRPEESTE